MRVPATANGTPSGTPTGTPSALSVVVASYNRAAGLRACLDALAAQTCPPGTFEVVVVDDGSTDDTRAMLDSLATPYPLRALSQANAGPSAARNYGAQAATGRTLLLLDDDVLADRGLVAAHLSAQDRSGPAVALGHLHFRLSPGADGFARFLAGWWRDHYAALAAGTRAPDYMDCFSGNLAVPRDAFLAAGGFAADLRRSEDVEIGYRLQQRGLPVLYVPEARATQRYTKRFRDIFADAEHAGVVAPALYRRHPPMLRRLPLGAFAETSLRALLLRRLLLALGAPPSFFQRAEPLLAASLALVRPFLGQRVGRAEREWYRFLSGYAYWRGVRRAVPDPDTWRRLTRGPLILMYHAIGGPGERAARYVVPAAALARQLAWLRARRVPVLSLEEVALAYGEHRLPPGGAVVLTFDDAYADVRCHALPLLGRHRFPATVFAVTRAGLANTWDRLSLDPLHPSLGGRPLMDEAALRDAAGHGVAVGAHSRTHRRLPDLPAGELAAEVGGSRDDLVNTLGAAPATFAYPYGAYDAAAEAAAERAGFLAACATHGGANSAATPLFALRRVEIRGTTSLPAFALTLWLGGALPAPRLPMPRLPLPGRRAA